MKYEKIVLVGGNGYLGGVLAKYFSVITSEVVIISRKSAPNDKNIKTIVWDGKSEGDWENALNGAELVVNLCGKNVNCRYNAKNKAEIISSRVVPTKLLGNAIQKSNNPPKLWINITSATIYRYAEDYPQDEIMGEIGAGFSIEVCKIWEETFYNFTTPNTRKIALRMGIVLGKEDGVFPRLLNLVKLGMGGKQGDGQQYVSWIHEHDVALSVDYLMNHTELAGNINCTSPEPVKNAVLMKEIRTVYKMPFGLPAPTWLLKIGAIMIGTETELILKSRWVMPTVLTNSGFKFKYGNLREAIKAILN
ncbi:TIGR01777 family protein [Pedobacter changchengzhani]|uniref:TIGR01777 family protein n=1 Tax=Pedobacter changchengzhani TaxID=2529274 RepID=A0A4R5MPS9_9SPHI|nr:TIGR01777 family oxidoreductase [Pedobacter changchengzhani]TDG37199.1 TIGR01777 family protein [Pedobacter changchengzhani]